MRYYLPWTIGTHNYEPGFRAAQGLAAQSGRALAVLVPQKNHLHDYMRGVHVVTPRSGHIPSGSFVVAMYPDIRMMGRFFHADEDAPFMVVDYHGNAMSAWAGITGAENVTEHRSMVDERPAGVRKLHEFIASFGYNGFTSPPGIYTIKANLTELEQAGWLDKRGRDYLYAHLFSDRSSQSIEELEKLVNKWFGRIAPTPFER